MHAIAFRSAPLHALAGAACLLACAAPAHAAGARPWPPQVPVAGATLAATGDFNWDLADSRAPGDARFGQDHGWRRREFGATLKKPGVYDAMVYFDFESRRWLDVFLRVETKALLGRDLGRVRVGHIKVPVGFEAVTSARAGSFVELAAPVQAIYQGRRTGVEWTLERPAYLLQAAGYAGTDLQGDNPGRTLAARAAWTPRKAAGDVLHLGLSASRESPDGWTDGRGVAFRPTARFRARPGSALSDVRLVDSGNLAPVDRVARTGLEALWIHGAFSLQGEALRADVARGDGLADYRAQGAYLAASWIATGESRPYTNGNVGNPKPASKAGALELVARVAMLDLRDGGIDGGRQDEWAVGANWYLTPYFKLQADYVGVQATRAGRTTRPDTVELRAQLHF